MGRLQTPASPSWLSMLLLLVAPLLLLRGAAAQNPGVNTLLEDGSYSKLRPCAQSCFYYRGGYTRDILGYSMRCSLTTTLLSTVAENECFCRTDLQLSAQLTISTCVLKRCSSNTNDVTSALGVYGAYCTANGYLDGGPVDAQPTVAGQGGGGGGGGGGPAATAGAGNGAPIPTAGRPSAGVRHAAHLGVVGLVGAVLCAWYVSSAPAGP